MLPVRTTIPSAPTPSAATASPPADPTTAVPMAEPTRLAPGATKAASGADAERSRGISAGRPLAAMRRRRPRWILAGVLAMVIGALGSVVLWTRVADTTSVLRLNRTVYRGEIVRAQDLTPITVGRLDGLDALPSDAIGTVVGRPARIDLAEGGLLTSAAVGPEELPAGKAVVGLRLEEGRAPQIPLEPGTSVLLVEAAADRAASGAGTNRAFRAEIHRPVGTSYDQVARLIDVSVARRDAEEIARLAAADRIILVQGS